MIRTSLIAQGKRRLLMSLLVAILIVLVYFHFVRFYQDRIPVWIPILGWMLVGLNLLRAAIGLAYGLHRHPFHRFDLGLREDESRPGGAFELELAIETRRPVVVRRLALELQCIQEKTTEGGREQEPLHRQEKVVGDEIHLESGESRSFACRLPVPPAAPFSFRSAGQRVRWAIVVLAEIEDWGKLGEEFDVTVVPG